MSHLLSVYSFSPSALQYCAFQEVIGRTLHLSLHGPFSMTIVRYCLSLFGQRTQNTADWGAYKQQTFLSHSAEDWTSQVMAPAHYLLKASSLGQGQPSSRCVLTWRKVRGSSLGLLGRGANPIDEG